MTSGRVSGGPSRDADAPARTTWTRDGIGAIALVLALGLVFRFIIVQLDPHAGFGVDLSSFQFWASNLADKGLHGFYDRDFFHDYTPGYLYVLYLVGVAGRAMGDIGDLIKIPPILADAALGWLVWSMVQELGGSRRSALIGAALVVANPVSWFDSALWGQVDSFGVVFLLLGMREVWRDRPERAAIYTVVAALIKPQLAILVPIVAVVTIRRALWPVVRPADGAATSRAAAGIARGGTSDSAITAGPTSDGDTFGETPGLMARFFAWERRTGHPIRILTTGLAGFLTALALCIPFGLSLFDVGGSNGKPNLILEMFNTASEYPYASVNAYNPWALASIDGSGLAANGSWACDTVILTPPAGGTFCPSAVTVGPFPAVVVGALLLVAAFLIVAVLVAWRPTPPVILVGLTVLAIAFFILPTRVHERYLFPFMALGAILAAVSLRWRIAYVVLSATTFLNMYAILTLPFYKNPGIRDWLGIGDGIRSTTGVTLVALAALAAAIWAFAQLRPAAHRVLDHELVAAGTDGELDDADDGRPGLEDDARPSAPSAAGATGDRPGRDDHAWPATGAGSAGAGFAMAAGDGTGTLVPRRTPLPTWTEPASFAELGPVGWFRARLFQRPIRADRSRGLQDEPSGRLDRLDLWILVVLVVSILGIRMFRLSEPYQMHFDEVYHARTAAEFLQDWRYGISHDIYEWTHPHLAKYAMAAGLVAWGDDRVTATSNLGVPVVDATIEPRHDDPDRPGNRAGDRIDVVTGSQLRSYDLVTRALVASVPVDGAVAVALDPSQHQLFVGSSDGTISTFDVTSLDEARAIGSTAVSEPVQFGHVDGAIKRLYVPDDGSALIVVTADDKVRTLDPVSSEVLGTVQLKGVGDVGPAGTAPTLVGTPGAVASPKAVASQLVTLLGGSAATYEQRLTGSGDRLIVAGISGSVQQAAVQKAIDDGRLAGLSIDTLPQVAVSDVKGLELINPASGDLTSTVDVGGAAHGFALVTVDDPRLYIAVDPDPTTDEKGRLAIVAVGGDSAKNGPTLVESMPMPGPASRVAYDDATEMVHVLGRTPDGTASTVYVVQSHADPGPRPAVYADARLPFEPTAWAIDVNRPDPTDDRQQLLVFDGAGSAASVDIGQHEFAWRLPGVLAGAAMAGFLYLLARILFRRRTVALFVAVLCVADGMFFVQSRIGMNDAYVGLGIVAAYTLFAALWTGVWRHRGAFWIAMPLIGALLGLALASKWVALYAIVGVGFLVLVRSALGRLLAIAALVTMTAVLGYLAINVPQGTGFGNLPFVALMVALTVAAVVANILHPLRWSLDEIRFAIGGPVVAGGLLALLAIGTNRAASTFKVSSLSVTPLELAGALALVGIVAWIAFAAAARIGFGPLAPAPAPDEPAALLPPPSPPPSAAWLRPGAQLGLPVVWMFACLLLLPVAIYILSYIPWAIDMNQQDHLPTTLAGIVDRFVGSWPKGQPHQSLLDLTGAMYNYHNGLTAAHPASSPWWAWLFDLKPVWFYQEGLGGNTTAAIYDAGNLVIWWLGLPALGFAAWQAFARRSLPLALITIGYAFQWVSWARIDRAAFQYHYYTSLPFLILALGYFLAELWHGASWRTWLLARLAAAVAILGPALFWIFDQPLCGFVGVDKVNPNSQACPPVIPQFLLTTQTAALATIVAVAVLIVVRLFGRLGSDATDADREVIVGGRRISDSTITLGWLGVTAAGAILATWVARTVFGDSPLISLDRIPVEPVAIVLALPAVLIAAFVATARDSRRFVVGAIVAIVGWFVIVYPNFSALPLPTAIANVYQGVLPTYLFAFQFPVNNVAATVKSELFGPVPLLLGAAVVFLSLVVGYSAWVWRLAIAERQADQLDGADLGPGLPRGAGGGATGD